MILFDFVHVHPLSLVFGVTIKLRSFYEYTIRVLFNLNPPLLSNTLISFIIFFNFLFFFPSFSGIFDDPAIVAEVKQCVETIKKSCVQFTELHSTASGSPLAMNQMIRWINTKEEHAKKIITIVSEYCLCQRVKKEVFESDADYVEALKAHHAVMQCAMKAKQSVDAAVVENLEKAVGNFAKMYIKD